MSDDFCHYLLVLYPQIEVWPLCEKNFFRSNYCRFTFETWWGSYFWTRIPKHDRGSLGAELKPCHRWKGDLVSESPRVYVFHLLRAVRSYQLFIRNISSPWKLIKIHVVMSMPAGSCSILLSCVYPFLIIDISSFSFMGMQLCACELV